LEFTESTVYPVLSRLAKDGWLAVRTVPSSAGPPRRYYSLTANGEKGFAQMTHQWKETIESLQELIQGVER
jgi:PadR family transcriptional regulator PadR